MDKDKRDLLDVIQYMSDNVFLPEELTKFLLPNGRNHKRVSSERFMKILNTQFPEHFHKLDISE